MNVLQIKDLDLQEFIKSVHIKKIQPFNISELQEKRDLAEQSGFETLAVKHNRAYRMQLAINKYKKTHLILDVPQFIKRNYGDFFSKNFGSYDLPINLYSNQKKSDGLRVSNTVKYVVLQKLKTKSKKWFSSNKTTYKILWEIPLYAYDCEVPNSIMKGIIQAKQDALNPKLWFVSTPEQFHEYVNQSSLDPAVVAYPNGIYDMQVILLGIWGKDIEDITSYFEEQTS